MSSRTALAASPLIRNATLTPQGTPDRILAFASEVFARSGYRGASTREIAEYSLVNEVTVFRHFKTKRELFFAVLDVELGKVQLSGDLLGRLAESTNGRAALFGVADVIVANLNPRILRLVQFGILEFQEQTDMLIRKHLGEFVAVLAGYLNPWIASGELPARSSKAMVLALLALVAGYRSMERLLPLEKGGAHEIIEALGYICFPGLPGASCN